MTKTTLSPREVEILQMAAHGCTTKDIATRLESSENTIKHHFATIYRKGGIKHMSNPKVVAVVLGIREGIIK